MKKIFSLLFILTILLFGCNNKIRTLKPIQILSTNSEVISTTSQIVNNEYKNINDSIQSNLFTYSSIDEVWENGKRSYVPITETVDLTNYPEWVRKNPEKFVDSDDALNTLYYTDFINKFDINNVHYDLDEDSIKQFKNKTDNWHCDSKKLKMFYHKGAYPANEIKVLNKTLLSKIQYVDYYKCVLANDSSSLYKEKIPFIKNDKFEILTGYNAGYIPELKEIVSYPYDTRAWFVCDLENNGKAYLCHFTNNLYSYHESIAWAELEYNNILEICSVKPLDTIDILYLNCPVGYFHQIETFNELQEWLYLYSSFYNKYINANNYSETEKIKVNKNGSLVEVSMKQHILNTRNNSRVYAHPDANWITTTQRLECDERIYGCNYDINDSWTTRYFQKNIVKQSDNNPYINSIIQSLPNVFKYSPVSLYGPKDIIYMDSDVFSDKDGTYHPCYKYTFENDTDKNSIMSYFNSIGIFRKQLSIDDFGNENIVKEVKDYVKQTNDFTYTGDCIDNKYHYSIGF